MRKKLTYILLLFCAIGFGQENEPAATFAAHGKTIPSNLYTGPELGDYADTIYINPGALTDDIFLAKH
jgi:hypothetical protein